MLQVFCVYEQKELMIVEVVKERMHIEYTDGGTDCLRCELDEGVCAESTTTSGDDLTIDVFHPLHCFKKYQTYPVVM